MSIADTNAPDWPMSAMTATERKALRALDRNATTQAPTREAFLADIAEAKRRHDARQRQSERDRNPFHLTDRGVDLLLVWPAALVGAAGLIATVAAFMLTDWR